MEKNKIKNQAKENEDRALRVIKMNGKLNINFIGGDGEFYVKKDKGNGNFIDVGYEEMGGMIYSMYDLKDAPCQELGNQTFYFIEKRALVLKKMEDGRIIIKGKLPSSLLNKLKDYNLKLVRKTD